MSWCFRTRWLTRCVEDTGHVSVDPAGVSRAGLGKTAPAAQTLTRVSHPMMVTCALTMVSAGLVKNLFCPCNNSINNSSRLALSILWPCFCRNSLWFLFEGMMPLMTLVCAGVVSAPGVTRCRGPVNSMLESIVTSLLARVCVRNGFYK